MSAAGERLAIELWPNEAPSPVRLAIMVAVHAREAEIFALLKERFDRYQEACAEHSIRVEALALKELAFAIDQSEAASIFFPPELRDSARVPK